MGIIIMLLIFAIALYIPIKYRYPKESKAHIHKIQKEIEKEREEEASRLKRYQSTPVTRNTSTTASHKTAGTTSRRSSAGTSKAASSKQQKPLTGSGKSTGIHFGGWPEEIHSRPKQLQSMKKGLEIKPWDMKLDTASQTAFIKSSTSKQAGKWYHVTLSSCECKDFTMNNHHSAPCKHIYALAHVLGLFSPEQYQAASKATPPDHFETHSEFAHIKFGSWPEEIHTDPKQIQRMKDGQTLRGRIVDFDPRTNKLLMRGSHDEAYHVTLNNCDCPDFCRRHLPCKHIYCLADSFGLLPTKPVKRATRSSSAYSNIKFGHWPRRCHSTDDQIERIKRGKKLKNTIITLDWNSQVACMKGDSNMDYYVTLNSCNCTDFYRRQLPCEHIYCLADTLGLLEPATTQKKNARS